MKKLITGAIVMHLNCRYFILTLLPLLFLSLLIPPAFADRNPDNPIEAGDVRWGRDLDAAFARSGESGKPVLVLFQEIPGCIGCQNFGSEVLTQPLLVEAIETLFEPVLVYNNRSGGKDAEWLKKYREPSWNFQVIRFLDAEGKDIIPRKDRIWDISGVASRMIRTLEKNGNEVPTYLRNLQLEYDRKNHKRAAFSMACFWTGEYKLGKIDGVISTEAGWYDNREVTLVTYHKRLINLENLVQRAEEERCAQRVYLFPGDRIKSHRLTVKKFDLQDYRKAKSSDQKKQLQRVQELIQVDNLTPMQLTKMNSFLPVNPKQALNHLSPIQKMQLDGEEHAILLR